MTQKRDPYIKLFNTLYKVSFITVKYSLH